MKRCSTTIYLKNPTHHVLYDGLQESMQDPKDHEGEKSKKRRHRGVGEYLSKKNKDQDEPPHFKRGNDDEEPRQDDEQLHEVHEVHEVQNNEIPGKYNLHKITKEDIDGPAFELRKGTYKNNIELEYNMDKCSLALTDTTGSILKYPSRQLFYKGSVGFASRHEVYSNQNIKSVQSIKVDKQYGYEYLEEIVVTRFDKKEYKFCESNFPFLNQNDIEYLYIMKIQNKMRNINGTEEYDLVNALKMYIYRIVIYKRVKDVQIGVESYQTKLNLTKPLLMKGCLH
ncbi:hypothetical protein Tco_0963320 [Tanacetum coccineum]